MATTTYGTPYVSGTDLVANWPAASLTVANSIDAAGYYVGRGINAQTASYTGVLTDAGKTVTMTNASANTFTVPANSSVAYPTGTRINILNLGAGACTPTAGAGVTISGTISALATNQGAAVVKTATNTWSYLPFSNGAAAAVVSSTTGSPTITTDGSATVYKFTGDGTIVIGTAGVARVLLVGAGSGAYGSSGLGGGAGGMQDVSALYLPAGTYTVKVGAGTASGTANGTAGDSFIDGLLGSLGGGGFTASAPTIGASTGAGTPAGRRLGGQGNLGFAGAPGGGGGAGGAGTTGTGAGSIGPGRTSDILVSGTPVTYSAGGQGGTTNTNGPANSGNGGAGNTGTGGSGLVVLRVG